MLYHNLLSSREIGYPCYLAYTMDELLNAHDDITYPVYRGPLNFDTLDEAMDTLIRWAAKHYIIIRKGSGNNKLTKKGAKRKVVLVCQCSGRTKKTKKDRKCKVIKTECPFRINLNYRDKSDQWSITKMRLEHNHPLLPT